MKSTRVLSLMSFIYLLLIDTRSTLANLEVARAYFVHKSVSRVVFYSCENSPNVHHTISLFNEQGIFLAILRPDSLDLHLAAMRVDYWRLGVILDFNCGHEYSKSILTESSKHGMYNSSYEWFVLGTTLNETIQQLNEDSFSMDTNFVIVIPTLYGYELYDVFNYGQKYNANLNVTQLGYWQQKVGLTTVLAETKYQRRSNLHGMKLKVISVTQYKPDDASMADFLQDYQTKELDSMSKLGYTILLHMTDLFNFTIDIVETQQWDETASDGSHSGMVGMLNRSEGDLGATPAIMFKERTSLCNLIGSVWPFRTCFMFRSPQSESDDAIRLAIFGSFALEFWVATIGILVLWIIILTLNLKFEYIRNSIMKWDNSILTAIGIMCQQGASFAPKYISGRIILLQLLIFSLLVYNYYSASVVSARLHQPLYKMNDSLHQLSTSDLRIASEPSTYINDGLTRLNDWEVREFYAKRWQPLSDNERFVGLEEAFQQVADGGFAYHTDPNTGYPYVERIFTNKMICELTEVHLYRPQKAALWASRNSPFTKMAKIALAKITSAGLLSRQVKRWASRKPLCFRDMFAVRSIFFHEVGPAFSILGAGFVLASVICILENFIVKR